MRAKFLIPGAGPAGLSFWLSKLPDVSFEDTLRSCLEHKACAKQPGHAEFYYPVEHGYGE